MAPNTKRVFYVNAVSAQVYIDILGGRPDVQLDKLVNDSPEAEAERILSQAHAYQIGSSRQELAMKYQGYTPLLQRCPNLVVLSTNGAGFDTVSLSGVPTVVSLHATKVVSAGEGAFVLNSDEEAVNRLRRRTNFGFDSDRVAQYDGVNAKRSRHLGAAGPAPLAQGPAGRWVPRRYGRQSRSGVRRYPDAPTGWLRRRSEGVRW